MKKLVYNGKAFAFVETSEPTPPIVGDRPRAPQKAAYGHRGMPYRLRNLRPISTGGNGYRPGPLLELGPDQCRYTIHGKTMCGAKCTSHPSWCDEHTRIVSRESYRSHTMNRES